MLEVNWALIIKIRENKIMLQRHNDIFSMNFKTNYLEIVTIEIPNHEFIPQAHGY